MITNGYCTLAEFHDYASARGANVGTDASDDTVIEDIIETVSRYIDGETGRVFFVSSSDETRYYTPELSTRVWVDDLVSITTIKSDDDLDRSYPQTISSTDYDLMPENAALKGWPYTHIQIPSHSDAYFATATKGVQIVGKFGFPSVPHDIRGATLSIAWNVYQGRVGQSTGGDVTVTGAGVVIRPKDVPALARATIDHYRRLY